jgi:non-canonical purine NTP pyrophosphatase (RdgB/HAM1 family)
MVRKENMKLIFVTGSEKKLKEVKKILSDIELVNKNLEIPEIQSFDLKEIAKDKAKKAYEILKEPVLVEDTAFYIEALNGLPGPFIKYFEEMLGRGAMSFLARGLEHRNASSKTCACYYDGKEFILAEGEVKGTLLEEAYTGNPHAFGYDLCFVPEGYEKCFAELGDDVKNKISHRAIAFQELKRKLNSRQ